MTERQFQNNFQPYEDQEILSSGHDRIKEEYAVKLEKHIDILLKKLDGAVLDEAESGDISVYTGITGIAYLYYHLGNYYHGKDEMQKEYYSKALELVQKPLRHLKGRRVTFLCGDAGPLALAAVLHDKLGYGKERDKHIQTLYGMHENILDDGDLPDELLYGRAGYLYALQFLEYNLGEAYIDTKIAERIWKRLIERGQKLAKREHSGSPLMFEWHGKKYLGAAHGLAGIFYILMQYTINKSPVFQNELKTLIQPSIDHIMTMKFPSGNYPSSIGSSNGDKLIHWCHGAPGWIHTFILAHSLFGDKKYLDEAKQCADVLWSRGLLRKGYGLCHGTAGNAYGFISLFNKTNDQQYLYRALKFADWCCDYGMHGCRIADRPFSLFEGLAGTVYFLIDLVQPRSAKFPGMQLQ